MVLWNKKGQREEKYKVYSISDIKELEIDYILISNKKKEQIESIKKQLQNELPNIKHESIMENKELFINIMGNESFYSEFEDKRVLFLRDLAIYIQEMDIKGNVAECGVYMADFSYYINKYFPERKMYLFDTFEGFDIKDIEKDKEFAEFSKGKFIEADNQFHSEFDLVDVIKKKLPNLEKCIIKKGYFPDTAIGIEDIFAFVNLDMDLYNPMYAGLEFFYDKMSEGGVILLHDYYRSDLPGVKKALKDFEEKRQQKMVKLPIGDGCSIAIIKT